MKKIRIEVASDHGIAVHYAVVVPRVGEYMDLWIAQLTEGASEAQLAQEVRSGRHGHERVEQVVDVVWGLSYSGLVVTVSTDCIEDPRAAARILPADRRRRARA